MIKKLAVIIVGLYLTASVYAGRTERATETVTTKGAKQIEIDCDLGAGEFNITTAKMYDLAVIDIEYDKRAVDYYVEYYEKGETGFLNLETDHRRDYDIDTEENRWDIKLSDAYETSLNMDIGACETNMDLGGLPLKEFNLDIGAASGFIEFSEPNKIRLEEIKIDAGASSLDMLDIGNANFDLFDFSGGVGSFDLDFRGNYKGESEIIIEIGLGSADIILPEGVPIRVETEGDNWLSSIDFHNDELREIDDGLYETRGFASAKNRIFLRLEVGLGSVDLHWQN